MKKGCPILPVVFFLSIIALSSCRVYKPTVAQVFAFRDSLITETIRSKIKYKAIGMADSVFVDSLLVMRKEFTINCRTVPMNNSIRLKSFYMEKYNMSFGLEQKYSIPEDLKGVYYFNKNDTFNYCEGDTFFYIFFGPMVLEKKNKKYVISYSTFISNRQKDGSYARFICIKEIQFIRRRRHLQALKEEDCSDSTFAPEIVPPFVRGSRPFFDENSGTYKYFNRDGNKDKN